METHAFRRAANAAGVTDDERLGMTLAISEDPMIGDLIPGTGGARKFRYGGKGKGKSGGYRVITYYAADDVPVFLLDLYAKGEKINLTQAERNELKAILGSLANDWRESVKKVVADLPERA